MRYFMPDYVGGGGPDKPTTPPGAKIMSSEGFFPSSSQSATARQMDVRDMIAGFIGRKDRDLSDGQAKKDYKYMATILGEDMARKVLNHVLIFNQRNDQQAHPFEKRLSNLYDIGSNDKDVDAFLKKMSSLEYGPIPGARASSNMSVMKAEGASVPSLPTPSSAMKGRSIAAGVPYINPYSSSITAR